MTSLDLRFCKERERGRGRQREGGGGRERGRQRETGRERKRERERERERKRARARERERRMTDMFSTLIHRVSASLKEGLSSKTHFWFRKVAHMKHF